MSMNIFLKSEELKEVIELTFPEASAGGLWGNPMCSLLHCL